MIALDTNILVHAHQREADLHESAVRIVREAAESAAPWAVCFHSLVEFYGVVTHPRLWRQPSSPNEAMNQIAAWRESPSLRLLTDSEAVLDQLGLLTVNSKVRGGQVHDARIAACCLTAGVQELWTVDRDFSRYHELRTRNPLVGA
ncbi:MAG: PIN domain-containing protein [Verrucomicrobia bacterium]|nr:PIN domain-containing protein [Verrucomicrobiota bacterium]